jgi:hypothetical protein
MMGRFNRRYATWGRLIIHAVPALKDRPKLRLPLRGKERRYGFSELHAIALTGLTFQTAS